MILKFITKYRSFSSGEGFPYGIISLNWTVLRYITCQLQQSWQKYNRNIKLYNIHIVLQTKLATNVLNYTGTAMNIYNVC